ncbi:hypothetical protein ANCDUO_24867 [Ancylostoma duodenale]|uniref:Uncharacterized protein n=1 Tax=Ancylostoma duodenale TaxID=51022 RepID=A0A0C2FJN7_9BILA|nr:hypothetical protein ANCDUO_24867 [Ancylostoma duodenale]
MNIKYVGRGPIEEDEYFFEESNDTDIPERQLRCPCSMASLSVIEKHSGPG